MIGRVLDRVPARKVVAAIAILACVSFLLLALSEARPASYLAVLLLGSAVGAGVNLIAFLTRRHFAAAVFGRLYGIKFASYIVEAVWASSRLASALIIWAATSRRCCCSRRWLLSPPCSLPRCLEQDDFRLKRILS